MSQLAVACSTDLMEYLIDLLQPLLDVVGMVSDFVGMVSDFVLGSYVLSSKPKTKSDPR